MACLNEDGGIMDAVGMMFSDTCLSEISRIDLNAGPLVDFPTDLNENIFSSIVDFGIAQCPRLVFFIISMVVRHGEPVLPSHVMKIATLFSSICYAVNKNLSALPKLRSLTLQVDGLSNIGLDMLSDQGLAQCARSLSNHRDMFAP